MRRACFICSSRHVTPVCPFTGSDAFGWSMYANPERTWFLHAGQHRDRTDGGVRVTSTRGNKASVLGVRLDLDQSQLAYYLDGEPHGPIAFTDLHNSARLTQVHGIDAKSAPASSASASASDKTSLAGSSLTSVLVFYPAISLSHLARVTLVTGLEPPSESEASSEASQSSPVSSRHSSPSPPPSRPLSPSCPASSFHPVQPGPLAVGIGHTTRPLGLVDTSSTPLTVAMAAARRQPSERHPTGDRRQGSFESDINPLRHSETFVMESESRILLAPSDSLGSPSTHNRLCNQPRGRIVLSPPRRQQTNTMSPSNSTSSSINYPVSMASNMWQNSQQSQQQQQPQYHPL
ncbi:unnamed protein product, partial [Protopolystoma xenopodis]